MKNNEQKNKYELEKLLVRGLGDEIDLDPFTEKPSIISGKYKNHTFLILFKKDSHIMFSIDDTVIEELEDFIRLLTSVMKSKPIFNILYKRDKSIPESRYLYIEWDVKNPLDRIYTLKKEIQKSEVSNIISIDFLEDEKKMALKK